MAMIATCDSTCPDDAAVLLGLTDHASPTGKKGENPK